MNCAITVPTIKPYFPGDNVNRKHVKNHRTTRIAIVILTVMCVLLIALVVVAFSSMNSIRKSMNEGEVVKILARGARIINLIREHTFNCNQGQCSSTRVHPNVHQNIHVVHQ